MSVTQTPSGTTTEMFVIQFRRSVAPDNWLTVADAPFFDAAGDAWNWTYDNPIAFEVRVLRRVVHESVEARPLDV